MFDNALVAAVECSAPTTLVKLCLQVKNTCKGGKGSYSLYAIPTERTWTFIFNKTWDQWAVEYNPADDALRAPVTPAIAADYREMMNFIIEKDGTVLLF